MKTLKMFRFAAASILALGVAAAHAGEVSEATTVGTAGGYDYMNVASQNMTVSAQVVANCTILVTGLDFGKYDPIVLHRNLADWMESDASITTECTQGTSPKITLTSASGFQLGNAGTDKLDYSLHTAAGVASGTEWPVGGQAIAATGYTDVVTYVYGKLSGGQDVAVGNYSDTVVVDIAF